MIVYQPLLIGMATKYGAVKKNYIGTMHNHTRATSIYKAPIPIISMYHLTSNTIAFQPQR